MLYKRIHLKDFKRMYLAGIQEFKMTFPDPATLILGTNGSGKSCLLNEISPLPADKDAFGVDGFKEVEFEYQGITYIVKTTFKKGTKCSFIRVEPNGEHTELNPGGTQAVLKTKVEEMFGYSDFIHQLLNNKHTFSNMATSKRREWFTNMSNVNYDYALSLYNIIKEKHRDKVGLVKELEKELADGIFSLETISDYEERMKESDARINRLRQNLLQLPEIIKSWQTYGIGEDDVKRTINEIREATLHYHSLRTQIILRLRERNIKYQPKVKDIIGDIINQRKQSLAEISGIVYILEKDLSELENKFAELRLKQEQINANKGIGFDKEELTQKRDMLKAEIDILQQNTTLAFHDNINLDDFEYLLENEQQIKMRVRESLRPLLEKDAYDRTYSKEKLDSVRNKLGELSLLLKTYQVEKEHKDKLRERQLAAMANKDNYVTCPKCKEHFYHGEKHEHLEDTDLNIRIENTEKEISSLQEQENKLKQTQQLISVFYRLDLQNTPLSGFHATVHKNLLVRDAPETIEALLENYLSYAKLMSNLKEIDKAFKEEQERRELENKFQLKELIEVEKQLEAWNKKLQDYNTSSKEINDDLQAAQNLYNNLNELDNTAHQLECLLAQNQEEVDELFYYELNCVMKPHIDEMRNALQEELTRYDEYKRKLEILKENDRKLTQAREDVKAYALLLDEMSPNTGMIADGLLGFIRVFLGEMNKIIARVWSYPLIVKVAEDIDEKGLTYRFPVITGTDGNEIPDVAMGSSGIQEIVNLAFKIVSMKYMGIGDFPLFLDEFGKTFDSTHRIQAGKVINTLISEHKHQQLFMVSHYSDSYGSMVNCNICVLDDTNIVLPLGKYNNNVQLSYKEVKND